MLLCVAVLIVSLAGLSSARHYEGVYSIQKPEILALRPKGFLISIDDSPGITMVTFQLSISREHTNIGRFSNAIYRQHDGKWTLKKLHFRMKTGDTVHYSMMVIKNGIGYRLDGGEFVVAELVHPGNPNHYDEQPINPAQPVPEPCRADNDPSVSLVVQPPSEDNSNALAVCEQTIVNVTQTLISLQLQVETLTKRNQQLTDILARYPDSKSITLSGRIPPGDDAKMVAQFIIREKLELEPDIVSAVRNSDKSITCEIATLAEKLKILEVAKENLQHSKILIF